MSEKISIQAKPEQLNYKAVKSYPPKYRYRKVPLFNVSSGSVVLSSTATQQLQFKLGADVYNLARSFMAYNLNIAASAGLATWAVQDTVELCNQIQFTDNGSMPITTVNYAQNYSRIMRKLHTKYDEYINHDITSALNPSNSLVNATPAVYPVADQRGNFAAGGCNANVNYAENQYVQVSALGGALNVARQIKLEAYPECIIGMDRDQYYGREMFLNILASPHNKICWTSTSVTDPTATPTLVASAVTLSNIYLYLAVEVNDMIKQSIKHKYATEGLSMLIPFPYMTKIPASTFTQGAANNLTYIVQNSQGLALQKIIWQPANGAETLNTSYDTSNYNGQKIALYQTSIDSNPLQDQQLSCLLPVAGVNGVIGQDDWRENEKFCKDSVLFNSAVYQNNWFHCDSWVNNDDVPDVPAENLAQGLPLDIARTWSVQANNGTGTAYAQGIQHYLFIIVQRELTVHPLEGITFDRSKAQMIAQSPEVANA